VSRSVLWAWRKQARRGVLVAEPAPMFMPLTVATDLSAPVPRADAASAVPPVPCAATVGRIEIALPDGMVIRVDEAIGSAALRRVVAALRG
jgi:transposase